MWSSQEIKRWVSGLIRRAGLRTVQLLTVFSFNPILHTMVKLECTASADWSDGSSWGNRVDNQGFGREGGEGGWWWIIITNISSRASIVPTLFQSWRVGDVLLRKRKPPHTWGFDWGMMMGRGERRINTGFLLEHIPCPPPFDQRSFNRSSLRYSSAPVETFWSFHSAHKSI